MRIITWIVVILVVVWIISNPAHAGDDIHGWVNGLFTFFQHLT